jgi:aminopeptidase YwaD
MGRAAKTVFIFILLPLLFGCAKRPVRGSASLPDFEVSVPRITGHVNALAELPGGRIAGFENEQKAALYIEEYFKAIGVTIRSQHFPITAFKSGGSSVGIFDGNGEAEELTSKPFMFSISTEEGPVGADLVFCGLGKPQDFPAEARGAVALIQRGEIYFSQKALNAENAGAIGVIIFNIGDDIAIGTLVEPLNIPVVGIRGDSGRVLVERLEKGETLRAEITSDTQMKPAQSVNLIAEIDGRKKSDSCLVIGAHIDSVDTPGANDNATGVAALLEIAANLVLYQPIFNVRLVFFGAEEIGLHGSRYYVSRMTADDREGCIAMINLDTIGSGGNLGLYFSSMNPSKELVDYFSTLVSETDLVSFSDSIESADHAEFAAVGIESIFLMSVPADQIHTEKDTIDRVDMERVADITRLCLEAIYGF